MRVYIDLQGIRLIVEIEATDTIIDVKKIIESKTFIPIMFCRLIFSDHVLDNTLTLSDYNITANSILTFIHYNPFYLTDELKTCA